MERKSYRSNLTDKQLQLIEPHLPQRNNEEDQEQQIYAK